MADVTEIDRIAISQLESTENLDDGSLLLVTTEDGNGEYSSKSVSCSVLVQKLKEDFGINEITSQIENLENAITGVGSLTVHLSGDLESTPSVISAMEQDAFGRIVGLSGFALSAAMSEIFENTTFDRINVHESPWLELTNIISSLSQTSAIGDPTKKGVSLCAMMELSNQIQDSYIEGVDIVSVLGDHPEKIASQVLARDISAAISSEYVPLTCIKNEIPSDASTIATTDIASLSVAYAISNYAEANFIPNGSVVDVVGDDPSKIASQKLVSDISAAAESEFLNKKFIDFIAQLPQVDLHQKADDGETLYRNGSGEYFFQTIMNTTSTLLVFEDLGELTSKAAEISSSGTYYLFSANPLSCLSATYDGSQLLSTPIDDDIGMVGYGRFTKNEMTNKTFYVSDTGFLKIAEY